MKSTLTSTLPILLAMATRLSHSPTMKSILFIVSTDGSVGAFVVAALRHPGKTQNKPVCVQGQLSSWNEIVRILEGLQSTKYTVTYTSIADVEKMEAEAWSKGDPAAVRLNVRRCMGTGNAKLENVSNNLSPEANIQTDLESIAKKVLMKQGLL